MDPLESMAEEVGFTRQSIRIRMLGNHNDMLRRV
jgi:hypothetical protein